MRIRRKNITPSMDSFLDIVTNVVGLMVLVFIVAVVNASDPKVRMRPPRKHEPKSNAERTLFECRGNRIVRIDEKRLDAAFDKGKKQFEGQVGTSTYESIDQITTLFERGDFGDEFYKVKAEVTETYRFNGGSLAPTKVLVQVYEPRKKVQGESVSEALQINSEFRDWLGSEHSPDDYLFFLVQPDSWEVFRQARRLARTHGWQTGWMPTDLDQPLRFSPSGRGTEID